ncbi:hypothetical protein SprV_0200521600 [Sparganum proliferum]
MDFLDRHHASIELSPLRICLDGTEVFLTDTLAVINDGPWWTPLLSGSVIDESSHKAVVRLLDEFAVQFDVNNRSLGHTKVLQHCIDTGDARPIRQAPRRIPINYQKDLEKMIQDMLNRSIIRPSSSPWASPIVLVKKKDGTLRLCVDYRRLNSVTKRDSFPPPRIDDTIDALSGAAWFSTLDLASGYWQVEVHPADRAKTAFVVPSGLYEFNMMPFGLANAPATFQRLMTTVLRDITPTACLIYLDDIIVHGKTVEEHNAHLREVLLRLRDAGLVLRTDKCKLLQNQTLLLGYILSPSGIHPDPDKISRICEWPTPKTSQEVRSFLGLASYYRKFVRGFAGIAAPLHRLTEKSRPFLWTKECEAAFDQLKRALTSPPILSLPDVSPSAGEFILDTDASDRAIGAVLSQLTADGDEKAIAFASRQLSKQERRYSTTRREMLALVYFLKYFRPYLLGRHFVVRTDHNALQWLQNFRDPEGQVARWQEQLQEYDFTCVYRPGARHQNADALSRHPTSSDEAVNAIVTVDDAQQWAILQAEDPDFGDIYDRQLHGSRKPTGREMREKSAAARALWSNWGRLRISDGVLFLHSGANEPLRLVMPKARVRDTVGNIHNQLGHAGQRKTEAAVRRRFWWPTIHQDVVSYCSACQVCAQIKSPIPAPRALLHPIAVDGPNHRIGVDIIGPLPTTRRGNRFILVMVDYFTKWCEAVPLQTQDARSVAAAILNDWISRYGAPTIIHSDRGTAFENHLLAELCSLLQINKTRTTPYHPEGNGLVERTNRTIKRILSAFVDRESSDAWDEHLPQCLLAYRTAVHDSTGFSPALLQLGHELRLPADIHSPLIPAESLSMGEYTRALKERLVTVYRLAAGNIQMAQQHQKTCYDRHRAGPEYHVGDSVLLFRPRPPLGAAAKFHRPWQGPYIIVCQPFPDTFVLRDPQRPFADVLTVHYNQIKPAPDCGPPPDSPLSLVPSGSLPPTLLRDPPTDAPYTKLKAELLRLTSVSDRQRYHALVKEEVLGDRKPSELLRRMHSLVGNMKIDDKFFKEMFLERLGTSVQTILASGSDDLEISKLAEMADRMMEVECLSSPTIAQVSQPLNVSTSDLAELKTDCPLVSDCCRFAAAPIPRSLSTFLRP